jgi:hypothetical protein
MLHIEEEENLWLGIDSDKFIAFKFQQLWNINSIHEVFFFSHLSNNCYFYLNFSKEWKQTLIIERGGGA